MKSSKYTRSTMEIGIDKLHLKFIRYLDSYIQIHKLGDVKSQISRIFVTINEKKGFWGKIKTSYTVICISPDYLIWGIIYDRKETGVAAAKWIEISEVCDWEETEIGRLYEDQGVSVFGFILFSSRRSRWFIGVDRSDSGIRCRSLIKQYAGSEAKEVVG